MQKNHLVLQQLMSLEDPLGQLRLLSHFLYRAFNYCPETTTSKHYIKLKFTLVTKVAVCLLIILIHQKLNGLLKIADKKAEDLLVEKSVSWDLTLINLWNFAV